MEKPFASCIVLDGPAIVNILQPRDCSTFKDYSLRVFFPFPLTRLETCERIDIIRDRYFKNTLKAKVRKKRGSGVCRRVQRDSKIPGNWQAFLGLDEKKEELFEFLATELGNMKTNKVVISTKAEIIVSNNDLHGSLFPCTQEEADTRIFFHVKNASANGHSTVLVRSVDTDVVVIAIALYQKLETLREFWVWFGTGKNQRFIPIHAIAESLGKTKSLSLPMLHSVTGCDQISFFAGRGKKNAWNTWTKYEELTKALVRLSYCPTKEDVSEVFPIIERFVVLLYDKTSMCVTVNECRKDLFARKGRLPEGLPPTQDALILHVYRAVYQASYQPLTRDAFLPDLNDWCWKNTLEGYDSIWTTLPDASKSCQELTKCGCKSEIGCKEWCKCVKASLKCSTLCNCRGDCERI